MHVAVQWLPWLTLRTLLCSGFRLTVNYQEPVLLHFNHPFCSEREVNANAEDAKNNIKHYTFL